LTKLANERQLLGNRRYRDEDAASNSIEYIPPYQTGSLSSPFAAMICGWAKTTLDNAAVNEYAAKLVAEHSDLKLSESEKLTITNWIDINCPFHPSYWGKKNAKYQAEPVLSSRFDVRRNPKPSRPGKIDRKEKRCAKIRPSLL
jgi:hypothetical protein